MSEQGTTKDQVCVKCGHEITYGSICAECSAKEQRPSKDVMTELRLRARHEIRIESIDPPSVFTLAVNEIEHLRRDNVRWENAHKILIAENDRLRKQIGELSIHAEKWVRRALGSAPEPGDGLQQYKCVCGILLDHLEEAHDCTGPER